MLDKVRALLKEHQAVSLDALSFYLEISKDEASQMMEKLIETNEVKKSVSEGCPGACSGCGGQQVIYELVQGN